MPPLPGLGPLLTGPRGAPSAFTPFDEPGMLAWWNSSNTSLDGSNNVISFLDVSGNGIAATSNSAPQRPAMVFGDLDFGGEPSCLWSNAADTLVLSDIISLGAYTLVQVAKVTASVGAYLMSMSAGDYVYGATGLSMFTNIRDGSGGSGYDADAGAGWFDAPTPKIWIRRMDGTHAGDSMRVDGATVPMHTTLYSNDPGTGHVNTIFSMMNYYLGGSTAVDGKWVTSLLYDHAVSDAVAAKLEAYFAALYSI